MTGTRLTRPARIVACVLLGALAVGGPTLILAQDERTADHPAPIPSPVLVLQNDGAVDIAYLQALSGRSIVFRDSAGAFEEAPDFAFIAAVATNERAEPLHGIGAGARHDRIDLDRVRVQVEADQLGVVELVDGQRFPGHPAPAGVAPTESIHWKVSSGSSVEIPLDRIARVITPWAGVHRHTLPRDASEDLVVLINGDELSGFVASINDVVTIESGDDSIEIEPSRIAGIVLANPRERANGPTLWFDDATVANAASMTTRADQLLVETPLGIRITHDIAHVRAFTYDASRITPLSDIVPSSQAPVGDRWRADPIVLRTHPDDLLSAESPALGALDVFLPGPMRIDYELPQGAERFVATAALTPEAGRWGDCHLVATLGGEELLRIHLNEQSPRTAINLPLASGRAGTTFTLTLEPGRYGPIRNQLTLHRPLIITSD